MLFNAVSNSSKKYIFLRISEKCSCNCVGCNLPKIQQNVDISLEKLDIILEFIDNNFTSGFELNFIGYDTLAHRDVYKIFEKNFSIPVSFHIDYPDIITNPDFIKKSSFFFTIQKNIYTISDLKKAISVVYFLQKHQIENVNIDFLFSFSENKKFFQYFCSHFHFEFENNFRGICSIGKAKIAIENIYSEEFGEKCNFVESYFYEDDKIFVKDNVEISLKTGNIKTHLSSYCNLGIQSLGNISDSPKMIYKNFQKAYQILKENEKLGNREKCAICLKKPIKL